MRLFALLALAGLAAPATIDRRIEERWKAEEVSPAPVADDSEFLRRLSLDLRGVIPTPDEVRAFAANRDASKREKTIDLWLRSDAFAAWWSQRWSDDLTIRPVAKVAVVYDAFRGWLRDSIRANMPYDRFARRILSAKGPTDLDPAAGFLATGLFNNPQDGAKDVVEKTARLFLGMQIRCAECHDHPFDAWTQGEFYGMTSFFWQTRSEVSTRTEESAMMMNVASQIGRLVDDASKGDPSVPGGGKEAGSARYRGGEGPLSGEARRAAFARLLVKDRQFARAAVNRHWGMLMGRGLMHPLDGFTSTRKPSHPELLEELADEFVASGFDVRKLLRTILLSKTYQLSSRTSGAPADRLFARTAIAPMLPEQLYSSLVRATGLDGLKAAPKGGKDASPMKSFREAFLREFQPPAAVNEPNPAGLGEPTILQGLYFMNGEFVSRGTKADPDLRLGALLAREKDPARRVEELFLATLSRPPTAREAELLQARLRKAGDAADAYENVFWALLNTTEFVTRH